MEKRQFRNTFKMRREVSRKDDSGRDLKQRPTIRYTILQIIKKNTYEKC